MSHSGVSFPGTPSANLTLLRWQVSLYLQVDRRYFGLRLLPHPGGHGSLRNCDIP